MQSAILRFGGPFSLWRAAPRLGGASSDPRSCPESWRVPLPDSVASDRNPAGMGGEGGCLCDACGPSAFYGVGSQNDLYGFQLVAESVPRTPEGIASAALLTRSDQVPAERGSAFIRPASRTRGPRQRCGMPRVLLAVSLLNGILLQTKFGKRYVDSGRFTLLRLILAQDAVQNVLDRVDQRLAFLRTEDALIHK